jgi:uncharacterized membrane protein (DUF4010 family)
MPELAIASGDLRAGYLFLTSLGVGLLIGLERQRNPSAKAGLRTCALVALFGTACALLSEAAGDVWIVPVGLALVGMFIIAAYRNEDRGEETDSGTTTVVAVLLCYVYGAMVWFGHERLAVPLGIVTTVLLHFKTELHGFTARLAAADVASILQFGVLTFIVLPLLPDEGYGPNAVLNPHHLWLMVVLIVGLGLAGYLALRLIGIGRGAVLVGLFGGLVSSTATTMVYAKQAASDPQLMHLGRSVITIANLVVLARLSVVGAVTTPGILPELLPVMGAALLAGVVPVVLQMRRSATTGTVQTPMLTNPTNLRVALGFAVLYGAVLLCSAWLSQWAGTYGLYALALVSGLVDVDAISLSSLQLFRSDTIAARTAVVAIALAYLANLAFKLGVVAVTGGRPLLRACGAALAAPALGMVAALAFL